MIARKKALSFLLLVLFLSPYAVSAQEIIGSAVLEIQPFANASYQEIEEALRRTKIVKAKELGTGVTKPLKFTLHNGQFEFHACYKSVDERFPGLTRMKYGLEVDFKDSWRFEVAAYELDKLLGLGMVPTTVERNFEGKDGSVQFWIENAMTEKVRKEKQLEPPDPHRWNQQISKVRVFDNLIYNIDRNLGNMLITADWKIYMIDHSRSFKSLDVLKSPKDLKLFSRSMMEAIQKLDESLLSVHCGKYLSSIEIKTLLERRNLILQVYSKLKAAKGSVIEFQ